jgi:hypothetical protein
MHPLWRVVLHMTSLEWMFLVVAIVTALVTFGWLYMRYDDFRQEVERDAGWHRVWHERIWQDEDEPR